MMKREERAKQFAPFEAVGGLRKALAKKEAEHERVERVEVSEARAARINAVIGRLERGTRVLVTYYSDGCYVNVEGPVTSVDTVYKSVKIGDGKIYFDDLYDIKVL